MQPEEKQKKKWKTPHTFVILVAIIIIAAIATYLIPAGEFTRFKDAATGKTLVEAGSYHRIASNPLNPLLIPSAIYTGIIKSASTITFMLIIGGAFEVITSTGALTALCKKLSKTFSKHKYAVIPVFLTLFSIFGFTMGMSSEVMIFVPIGITLALFLGLDKVTGTAMIALGAAVGFTAGILNPFNVGVAQDIAELPLFSGMAYRIVILVILLAATSAYIIIYAKKVAANPEKSVIYGIQEDTEYTFEDVSDSISKSQIAVLVIMAAGFGILIYGLSKKGWYFEEMSGLFIFMGIACGLVSGYGPSRIAKEFGNGAKGIVVGCLIIGIARTVEVILSDAKILDTIVYGIVNIVNVMPGSIKAVGMFICQSLINCVIVSGTGQAAVTMPLMVPVSDLVGISRQTAVLAFQLGDGFSNSVLPMSSSLMGYLAVSKIPYSKWLKFMMPLFLIWTALGCLFMLGALIIGY
ncbi:MAG: AbgT family transporter [Lachnospira sp.]|nr:AbgT family transporter [Lachnospira sp.]